MRWRFVRTCCAWSSGDFRASCCDRISSRSSRYFLCLIRRSYQRLASQAWREPGTARQHVFAPVSSTLAGSLSVTRFRETLPMTTEGCALRAFVDGPWSEPTNGWTLSLGGRLGALNGRGGHVPVGNAMHQLLG